MFDVDLDDGMICNRCLFVDYSGFGDRFDGVCVDVDGGFWMVFFLGCCVVCYWLDGRIDMVILLFVINLMCLCFGGNDLKMLFVIMVRKFLNF